MIEMTNRTDIETVYSQSPGATLPVELAQLVTLNLNCDGTTVTKSIRVHDILKSMNSSLICVNGVAYLGDTVLPALNSSDVPTLLHLVSAQTRMQIIPGSIVLAAGKVGASQSLKVSILILNNGNGTFQFSTGGNLKIEPGVAKIARPYDGALRAAANKATTFIGKYMLVANINSSNKVTGFQNVDTETMTIVDDTGISCPSVINFFPGYTCL